MQLRLTSKVLILSLALTISSCQSSEVNAQKAKEKERESTANAFTQEVKALAQKYPAIHRVTWKVCGVERIKSLASSEENQCVESERPMLVWAATGAHKLIPTHQYTGGIQSHLFVESQGCFGIATPTPGETAKFYKQKTFLVGVFSKRASLPTPTAQVKVTQLSQQEKEDLIAEFLSTPPEAFETGISSDYDCRSEKDWTEKYQRAIPR